MRPEVQRVYSRAVRRLFSVALVLATSSPAVAYRTQSDARWERKLSIGVSGNPPGVLTTTEVIQTTQYAIGRWVEPECAALEYEFTGASTLSADSGDGRVTVEILHSGWTEAGFDLDAAATTRVIYREDFSEIVDADVFINAESYDWTLGPSEGRRRNLLAALVHELGHVIGLLHPCDSDVGCESPPTVMVPFFDDVDASLRADDVAGVCSLYGSTNCEDCAPPTTPPPCVEQPCGELGDPCGVDRECASGTCVDGSCSVRCDAAAACPARWECGPESSCRPSSGESFGGPCVMGEDCTSGVCVLVNGTGTCSRACLESCPNGFACTSIETDEYCVAPEEPMSRGCSSGLATSSPGHVASALMLAISLLRRRSRGKKC